MKKGSIILLLLACIFLMSHLQTSRESVTKQKLSEYGFFDGPIAQLKPAAGVIPYELNSSLFSNYAEKIRFMVLPPGKAAVYQAKKPFDLPLGTVLVKNFYYPVDFRQPDKGRYLIETRLLIHEETGWNALPYIWNADQTEAYYDVAGDTRTIGYIDSKGKKRTTHYAIPNKNQCKGCHTNGKEFLPIGISARHLNKTVHSESNSANQLLIWAENGWLKNLPDSGVPANANWEDESSSIDQRARAYLDINCGHCHSVTGPANTSGLYLDMFNQDPTALGIHKTPVAAGRGSGNFSYAIVPGKPEKSILVYRMNTIDPGIAMPELGREQIHKEGVALISEWIKQMKP
ncbi:SO2930 family diheme c-type cytochrome [Flavihumibacter sp. UBA7668]|uniref:SO2930 family diheme c-type cytochrome n=1 Tax=Flavihumibacter sp. UBA7668 TaxID=1946542 RepID=UPI0025C7114D|nr:SO2930 family diheme c-type cytochrome [Flavihumibacter sp. UBA7668]